LRFAFDNTYGRLYKSFHSWAPVRHRVAPYLDQYPGVRFSRTGTGFSQHSEVDDLARLHAVNGKDVLLVGVEVGTEVESLWARHGARSFTGIDIGDYESQWAESIRSGEAGRLSLRFAKMDASSLGFRSESFDLVYSQGVLPHVTDLATFLDDAARVLRPGGVFYAFCCPLWWTYGGSHVHELGFDHLRLEESEYLDRAMKVEDGSWWWLKEGLFNKLRFRDVLGLIEERFDVIRVGVIEAPDARRFRKDRPDVWSELRRVYDEEDLMIRLTSFVARRR
jgi:SAM-dependent methyltransferase